jgi:hypothetical protein
MSRVINALTLSKLRVFLTALFTLAVGTLTHAAIVASPSREILDRAASPRIDVGPNILVSDEMSLTHIEPTLVADPNDAKHLVGAVTVQHETNSIVTAYTSFDGGFSWESSHPRINGSGDPQLAIGKTGTVYFPSLGTAPGDTVMGLYVSRSEDGGITWQKPIFVSAKQDHPQVVVDRTGGRFDGRVYIGALYGATYKLGLFRSSDDGRTWEGPLDYVDGGENYGNNTNNALVMSDGTLFLPSARWDRVAQRKGEATASWADFVLTNDGGDTFSKPKEIRKLGGYDPKRPQPRAQRREFPEYAIGPAGTPHVDRIYMVFPQVLNGYTRIYIQYSDDKGETWSTAKLVDPVAPANSEQFNQMVTANKDGVVGVSWFDTRQTKDGSGFDKYFSASVDGGVTFLPAKRVSTVTTRPDQPGNKGITPGIFSYNDSVYIYLSSASGRLNTGGDYMGLTADANGAFHLLWPDTRTGVYQLFTSRVRVVVGDENSDKPANVTVRRLTPKEFQILFDPIKKDAATQIVSVPFRVKNRMDTPIYGPITLRLDLNDKLGDVGPEDKKNYPIILGAKNGKSGPGAEFDLTPIAGSGGVIQPGETTGQFILRLKPNNRRGEIGNLLTFVSAGVAR